MRLKARTSRGLLLLGSARASRAGDGGLAVANFFFPPLRQKRFRRGAEIGTRRRVRSPEILLGIALVFFALNAFAAETIPPKPAGYFNDYAGVVPKEVALQLNEKLAQFERETSDQILVVVWPNFPSASSIEDFTQRTFQAWTVGQKGTNNGAVLFVFVSDHKMRIQTGYGLEGALPDTTCFDIIQNVIAPHFKQGDYASGLDAGIDAMMQAVRGEYKGTGKTVREGQGNSGNGSAFPFIIIFIIVMIAIARASRRRGRGFNGRGPFIGPFIGGWGGGGGGGSSGGGFSGFGGGGGFSGGGGASGGW